MGTALVSVVRWLILVVEGGLVASRGLGSRIMAVLPRVGTFLRYVGVILRQTLGVAQTLAILLAGLIATDFFILTPNVTATWALEDRVSADVVKRAYMPDEPPSVVSATLDRLDSLSFDRLGQVGDPYPLSDLCRKQEQLVDEVVPGGCAPLSKSDVPFFDRVLLNVDIQATTPLDGQALLTASKYLAAAQFVRARVTVLNTGRSVAQNLTVTKPDSYEPKSSTRSPMSLGAGQKIDLVYDSGSVGLSPDKATDISNPVFVAKADPTGPVDPGIITGALYVCVGLWVLALLAAIAGAGEAVRRDEGLTTESHPPA